MIYFTDLGDTAEKVCHKLTGKNNASYAALIRKKNYTSFAARRMPGSNCFAPNRALWIPSGYQDPPQYEINRILHTLDWIYSDKRAYLKKAQQMGIDIRDIVGAHKLIKAINKATRDETIGLVGAGFSLEMLHGVMDLKNTRFSAFNNAIENLKTDLRSIAQADSKEIRDAAKVAYRKSYQNLSEQFSREMASYRLSGDVWLKRPCGFIDKYKGKAWEIWDDWFARDVERAAKGLKIVGPVLFCSNVGIGAYETVQAYRDGQDWIKEAIKETADIATFAVIGYTIAGLLGLSSIGWIAALGIGAGEAALNEIIDRHFVNPEIDKLHI